MRTKSMVLMPSDFFFFFVSSLQRRSKPVRWAGNQIDSGWGSGSAFFFTSFQFFLLHFSLFPMASTRDIEMSRVDDDREAFLPAPAQQRRQLEQQYPPALVAVVVAFYFMISLAVVFLNKLILSSSEYKFPYPLFVTWFQLLVALGLLIAWAYLGQ